MEKTLKYAIKLDPDVVVFNITTPFPGTEVFKWADENGYLKTKDWSQYNFAQPILELPTVSSAKVEEFYKKAFRKFYFRPRYLLRRLYKISAYDANTLKAALKFFFRWILGFREEGI